MQCPKDANGKYPSDCDEDTKVKMTSEEMFKDKIIGSIRGSFDNVGGGNTTKTEDMPAFLELLDLVAQPTDAFILPDSSTQANFAKNFDFGALWGNNVTKTLARVGLRCDSVALSAAGTWNVGIKAWISQVHPHLAG